MMRSSRLCSGAQVTEEGVSSSLYLIKSSLLLAVKQAEQTGCSSFPLSMLGLLWFITTRIGLISTCFISICLCPLSLRPEPQIEDLTSTVASSAVTRPMV